MSRLWFCVMASVFVVVGLSGCQNPDFQGLRIQSAPENIEASFQVKNVTQDGQPGVLVGLKKSSLEKYFLLIPQLRSTGATGHLTLFEPQVVYFKSSGAQVGLFELNTASIYDDIQSDHLLQSFKVRFETADFVYFDWNYGLEAIVARSPYASGSPSAKRSFTEGSDSLLEVVQSYIDKAELKNNVLRVRQVSRVRETVLRFSKDPGQLTPADEGVVGGAEKRDSSITMDLVIRPYDAKKKMVPITSKIDKGFGYFTRLMSTPGTIAPRDVIMKWDFSPERPPVRVRVSKNVPAHLLSSVVEGIEYWNRVIGRQVLVLETGVSPQAELEERTIMVHWVSWKDAGFAYAGFQSDPLSGEILQGQIFMTSSWELLGHSYQDLLGSTAHVQAVPQGGKVLASSCQYHRDIGQAWAQIPAVETPDKENALEHVIRNVVAHEMGHVMGLRHNFAGSFHTSVDPAVHLEKTQEFLKEGKIAALPTTISVMDYSNAIDDVMTGKYILTDTLEYDREVVAWGYLGDNSQTRLRFCTDNDMPSDKKSIGCDVFDSGRFPAGFDALADSLQRDRGLWRDHAQLMFQIFPEPSVRMDLDEVLNTKDQLLANQPAVTNFLAARDLFIAEKPVLNTKDLKNWEAPEAVALEKKKSWLAQVDALGLISLFELALPWSVTVDANGASELTVDSTYWERQLQKVVAQPRFLKGVNVSGVSYDLSIVEAQRLEKFLRLRLGADPLRPGLMTLAQSFPGPGKMVMNIQTGKPEKKDLKYLAIPSLKEQMPEVLKRALTLMTAGKSEKAVVIGEGQSVVVPARLFAPPLFNDWAGLFDERFNPNSSAELYQALLVGLKAELNEVYALWGISQPSLVATVELRRLFTEKAASLPVEAKTWIEAELTRIEFFEKFLTEKPAAPAASPVTSTSVAGN